MKRIALIVLYFGKIPNYAELFFHSLQYNPSIDVLLFTDQIVKKKLKNLIIYRIEFDEIRKLIQNKFDFTIVLDKPYKLCDYRPAYGYIFEDKLINYDFWGHCDIDIILGNIRKFLSEDILNAYDKIYQHGHMCLYRNTKINNMRFMSNVGMDYKKVFTTAVNCVFDEIIGMQKKYDLLNIATYKERDCADISPWHDSLRRVESYLTSYEKRNFNYAEQIFYWETGHLYRAYIVNNSIFRDEFNYLHFQKRDMLYDKDNNIPEAFYITRDGIVIKELGDFPDQILINKYNGKRNWKEFNRMIEYRIYIWKRRINKYFFHC